MKVTLRKGAIIVSLAAAIVIAAKSYIGQEETPGNSGFKDKVVEASFKHAGWTQGASWCVFFCKVVYDVALSDAVFSLPPVLKDGKNSNEIPDYARIAKIHDRAMKLIVGNSQSTLANFSQDNSGMFMVTDSAVPGGIIIFQEFKNGKGLWSGHAGICIEVNKPQTPYKGAITGWDFTTVEGNTNDNGSSNGYKVAIKHRRYCTTVTNGLRYRKCISINYYYFTQSRKVAKI